MSVRRLDRCTRTCLFRLHDCTTKVLIFLVLVCLSADWTGALVLFNSFRPFEVSKDCRVLPAPSVHTTHHRDFLPPLAYLLEVGLSLNSFVVCLSWLSCGSAFAFTAIPIPAMIQGYHAYSLPRSHNWSAGHFSPSRIVLCCVFWFVLLCVFVLWFCFVFRFLFCDGIVTALDYVSVHHLLLLRPLIRRRPSLRQLTNSLISATCNRTC